MEGVFVKVLCEKQGGNFKVAGCNIVLKSYRFIVAVTNFKVAGHNIVIAGCRFKVAVANFVIVVIISDFADVRLLF